MEKRIAHNIRKAILDMVYSAQTSHIGSALSVVDILVALYNNFYSKGRDKLIFSKGHAAVALYSTLAEFGYINKAELSTFCQTGSMFTGHINHKLPNIELSTGSLGHGLSVACGLAYAKKIDGESGNIFVILGDGEMDEGSNWEAASFGYQHSLDNLIAIIDLNNWQGLGKTCEVLSKNTLVSKYNGFGWNVIETNGHDFNKLNMAFKKAVSHSGSPTVIIAKTVKGKGIDFMEDKLLWHYRSPRDDEYKNAVQILKKSE